MRLAIISDIHANLEALRAVFDHLDSQGIEHVICLGDVVGYNANPNECCELLRERDVPTILGNHDAVACGVEEPWGFNPVALSAALWTRQHISEDNVEWLNSLPDLIQTDWFIAVHGAPSDRNYYMFNWEDVLPFLPFLEEHEREVCFFGHTHQPGIFAADGVYSLDDDDTFELGHGKRFFINPGSVGQPRDGNPEAAFGIIDTELNTFRQVRIPYPVEQAAQRILDAGLPQFLAERLGLGR